MLSRSERYRTAHHEAGHAVIGRVLGISCGPATVVPDYAEGTAGFTITPDLWAIMDDWDKPGDKRARRGEMVRSIMRARIMTTMAGKEAANVCCGPGFDGDSDDLLWIDHMMNSSYFDPADYNRVDRLRRLTRALCIRHRDKIERVAAALLRRGRLSAKQLDKLVQIDFSLV